MKYNRKKIYIKEENHHERAIPSKKNISNFQREKMHTNVIYNRTTDAAYFVIVNSQCIPGNKGFILVEYFKPFRRSVGTFRKWRESRQ